MEQMQQGQRVQLVKEMLVEILEGLVVVLRLAVEGVLVPLV
jgi:hypothetical protein